MHANLNADFLTVATVSYLPQALATLRSARRAGGFGKFHLFALDAAPGSSAALGEALGADGQWIHVFCPDELSNSNRRVIQQALRYYNPVEMSCLGKYVGVDHVLTSSSASTICVYADSDIFFFADVEDALCGLDGKAIMLTPHQLGPSDDASEHDYLLHGWINAGFFAADGGHYATKEILGWLINRISRRGFLAPELGMSCDQTWVSLLPAMFSAHVAICRHPGCNVAYWNLAERSLHREAGHIWANDGRLLFFHFSGFSGAGSGQLTRHGNFVVPKESLLEELCRHYGAALGAEAKIRLANVPVLSCAMGQLRERLRVGSDLNGINLEAPTTKRGLFTRVGAKLDSILAGIKQRAV